jgi:hypothetical protein
MSSLSVVVFGAVSSKIVSKADRWDSAAVKEEEEVEVEEVG